jgi:hypothetical protein
VLGAITMNTACAGDADSGRSKDAATAFESV